MKKVRISSEVDVHYEGLSRSFYFTKEILTYEKDGKFYRLDDNSEVFHTESLDGLELDIPNTIYLDGFEVSEFMKCRATNAEIDSILQLLGGYANLMELNDKYYEQYREIVLSLFELYVLKMEDYLNQKGKSLALENY